MCCSESQSTARFSSEPSGKAEGAKKASSMDLKIEYVVFKKFKEFALKNDD